MHPKALNEINSLPDHILETSSEITILWSFILSKPTLNSNILKKLANSVGQ